MTETESKGFSEFSFYVTAQIDRINSALKSHHHFQAKIDQINAQIEKQQHKFHQIDKKLRLLQVYQSQNFKNNERLFNSHLTYDALDKKIVILERMQLEIVSHGQQNNSIINQQTEQRFQLLQKKIKEVENQIQKIRGRNVTLSKFRRDVSPNLVNCDSTKDISIDRKSNRNEEKKMEIRIHEYINQRLQQIQKKFSAALSADRQKLFDFQLPELENESFLKNRLTSDKAKEKIETNVYQMNEENKVKKGFEQNFRNTIDSYYNQATQKQDIRDKNYLKKKNNRRENTVNSQKSSSRSKSKKKTKQKSTQKPISLRSVNEYLKLADKNK